VDVFIMTDHANNNVIVFGRDNRDFITVFILLVVFAFGKQYVNRGYVGVKEVLGATIILPKKALKRDNRYQRDKKRKLCKRRAAIEPIIVEKIATSYHTQPNFLPKQKNSSGN
jgi:hypothetical protein